MKRTVLDIIGKIFYRDPWKKADFYKRHHFFHRIGDGCYISSHITYNEGYLISIGNNVWITSGVHFINHDASTQIVQKNRKYHGVDKVGVIKIGDNVFIGNNCILLPGVEIGDNCVIGAGAVVTKCIPSNSVVAGNPAKIICSFDEYADKCIEHSDRYPWLWASSPEEVYKKRMTYFWEEGHLR